MAYEQFQERYEALRPGIPSDSWDREWYDRLRSWDDFQQFGPMVARDLRARNPWEPGQSKRLREMYPELAALVLEAFPKA